MLLLLNGGGPPAAQPGVRSLLAFWVGGAALAATVSISGSAAVATAAPTVTASGEVPYAGTAAVTTAAPTVSASGALRYVGTAAVTTAAPTVSLTGKLTAKCTVAVTAAAPTVSLAGKVTAKGTAAVTTAAPTVAVAGKGTNRATVAVSTPAPTVALSGTVGSVISGAAAVTVPAPTVAASGTITLLPITGTAAVSTAAPTVAASGTIPISGDINPNPTAGFPYAVARVYGKTASNALSRTVTLPPHTAGQLVCCVASIDGYASPVTASDASWTILEAPTASVTGVVAWKIAASGSESLTLSFAALEQLSWVSSVYATAGSLSGSASTGSGADSDSPTHAAHAGAKKYLWVSTRSGDGTVQPTAAPSGYTPWVSQEGGTGAATTDIAEREVETSGSVDPGAWTVTTEQWVCWTLAISPDKERLSAASFTRTRSLPDVTVTVEETGTNLAAETIARARTLPTPTVSVVLAITVRFSGEPTKVRRARAFTTPQVIVSEDGTDLIPITETVTRARAFTTPAVTLEQTLPQSVVKRSRTLSAVAVTVSESAVVLPLSATKITRSRALSTARFDARSQNAPPRRAETTLFIRKELY